jgi:hypothetical protein
VQRHRKTLNIGNVCKICLSARNAHLVGRQVESVEARRCLHKPAAHEGTSTSDTLCDDGAFTCGSRVKSHLTFWMVNIFGPELPLRAPKPSTGTFGVPVAKRRTAERSSSSHSFNTLQKRKTAGSCVRRTHQRLRTRITCSYLTFDV